jgi:hypothetical protein
MDDIGTSDTKHTWTVVVSAHLGASRRSRFRIVAFREVVAFRELVLSFQQTERVQVRVGEPSIIGVGCGGVPLPPNS